MLQPFVLTRGHRREVNAIEGLQLSKIDSNEMPLDCKRMACGAANADCAGEFTDTQKEMQKLAEMGETLLFMDWFKLL